MRECRGGGLVGAGGRRGGNERLDAGTGGRGGSAAGLWEEWLGGCRFVEQEGPFGGWTSVGGSNYCAGTCDNANIMTKTSTERCVIGSCQLAAEEQGFPDRFFDLAEK